MSTTTSPPTRLSEGVIEQMVTEKRGNLPGPLVQVLSTKPMANGRLRAVISDGVTTCQHCIFLSTERGGQPTLADPFGAPEEDDLQVANFSVVRLDDYNLSELADKGITIIMVPKVTTVLDGE